MLVRFSDTPERTCYNKDRIAAAEDCESCITFPGFMRAFIQTHAHLLASSERGPEVIHGCRSLFRSPLGQ